jgi:hypothetical protein
MFIEALIAGFAIQVLVFVNAYLIAYYAAKGRRAGDL